MKSYIRSHLADETLARNLVTGATRLIDHLADHLADLAECDERRLYLPAAYPSMLAYCKARLPFPEDTCRKHIHAVRAARRFPAIFPALADGRLHLCGVLLLASHLTTENADELLPPVQVRDRAADRRALSAVRVPRHDPPDRGTREPGNDPTVRPGAHDVIRRGADRHSACDRETHCATAI